MKAKLRDYREFRLLLTARLDGREAAVGSVDTWDETLARREAEEEDGHGEDDGRCAEPAGAEEVTQDTEPRPQYAGGNARCAAYENDDDTVHREQDADDAGDLTGQRSRLVFTPRPERGLIALRAYIIPVPAFAQNHPSGFILTASHPSIIPFL